MSVTISIANDGTDSSLEEPFELNIGNANFRALWSVMFVGYGMSGSVAGWSLIIRLKLLKVRLPCLVEEAWEKREGVVKTSWSDIDAVVVGCKDGVPTKNSTNV